MESDKVVVNQSNSNMLKSVSYLQLTYLVHQGRRDKIEFKNRKAKCKEPL